MMGYSLHLFGLPSDQYLPIAQRAERLGFETLWIADHVITPTEFARTYPYASSGDPGYRHDTPMVDVAVTLSYLAAATTTIRLASGVLVLPLRNPFLVARSWANLQHVSRDRAVLGVGAGWMREEYDALGVDFTNRGSRFNEQLEILDLLWSGRPAAYRGQHHRFDEVHFAGAPATPIPIVIGGHSPAALRRTARMADGWFGPNVELGETRRLVAQLHRERHQADRERNPFATYVRLHGGLTSANASRYADEGFEDVVLAPFVPDAETSLDERLRKLDELAAELEVSPMASLTRNTKKEKHYENP